MVLLHYMVGRPAISIQSVRHPTRTAMNDERSQSKPRTISLARHGGVLRALQLPTRLSWVLLIVAAGLVSACASLGRSASPEPTTAFVAEADGSRLARYAPVFLHQNDEQTFNRIGRAAARYDDRGKEQVYIDPSSPTLYVQERHFTGQRGEYTNLIYRVHFDRVPLSWVPFHVTAGRNMGLLVVVTLDGQGRPVLVTTVHTCGCYVAFVPTDALPADAYPQDWESPNQKVFGETLPSRIRLSSDGSGATKLGVLLRDGNHRVMDLQPLASEDISARYRVVQMAIEPIEALKALPLNGTTTSFYHTSGPRRDYVKNIVKPFELLLLSWWVFDLNVGVDKEYGETLDVGRVFYTSLKPWRRKQSDMRAFADFLTYWGWKL